jgi:hypothetical protein
MTMTAGWRRAAFTVLFVLSAASPRARGAEEAVCRSDADCKLIYSSCTCEAAPSDDARTVLGNDHGIDCHHNACRAANARAVCDSGRCMRIPVSFGQDAHPAIDQARVDR